MKTSKFKTWFIAGIMFFSIAVFTPGCDLLFYLLEDVEQVDNSSNNDNSNSNTNSDETPTSKGKTQSGG